MRFCRISCVKLIKSSWIRARVDRLLAWTHVKTTTKNKAKQNNNAYRSTVLRSQRLNENWLDSAPLSSPFIRFIVQNKQPRRERQPARSLQFFDEYFLFCLCHSISMLQFLLSQFSSTAFSLENFCNNFCRFFFWARP